MTTSPIPSETHYEAFFPEQAFFDELVALLIALHSYTFALHVSIASNNPKEFNQRSLQEWINYIRPVRDVDYPLFAKSNSTGLARRFYPVDLLMHLSLNSRPDFIRFQTVKFDDSQGLQVVDTQDHQSVVSRLIGSTFVSYFESQRPALDAKFHGSKNWPQDLTFARHVRNGFAHHGVFDIRDNTIGHWRIWQTDQTNNGQSVMRSALNANGLGLGDVIELMELVDLAVK